MYAHECVMRCVCDLVANRFLAFGCQPDGDTVWATRVYGDADVWDATRNAAWNALNAGAPDTHAAHATTTTTTYAPATTTAAALAWFRYALLVGWLFFILVSGRFGFAAQ